MPTNEQLLDDYELAVQSRLKGAGPQHTASARAAVLARMMPAEPSTVYDTKNGEWSVAWADRTDEEQVAVYPDRGVVRFTAMYEAGEKWCVCLPDGYDDEGTWDGWHLAWFDTEAEAVEARAKADKPDLAERAVP